MSRLLRIHTALAPEPAGRVVDAKDAHHDEVDQPRFGLNIKCLSVADATAGTIDSWNTIPSQGRAATHRL